MECRVDGIVGIVLGWSGLIVRYNWITIELDCWFIIDGWSMLEWSRLDLIEVLGTIRDKCLG